MTELMRLTLSVLWPIFLLLLGILGVGFGLVVLGKRNFSPELVASLLKIGRILASALLTLSIFVLCLPQCYAAALWILFRLTSQFSAKGTAAMPQAHRAFAGYLFYTGLLDSTYVAIVGWWWCIAAFVLWLILLVVSREWITKLVTLAWLIFAVYGIHAARAWLAIVR